MLFSDPSKQLLYKGMGGTNEKIVYNPCFPDDGGTVVRVLQR